MLIGGVASRFPLKIAEIGADVRAVFVQHLADEGHPVMHEMKWAFTLTLRFIGSHDVADR